MKYLKVSRFIDLHGYRVIIILGMAVILFSGLVFYFYGLKVVSNPRELEKSGETISREELNEALDGLEARSLNENRLKKELLKPSDIFR